VTLVAERPAVREVALRRLLGTDAQSGPARAAGLPASLAERYGSDLVIPLVNGRPTLISNFVTTLDGVVSFDPELGHGGGEVSGFFEPDRFVMALLRSVSDAVMIGAGTIRADPNGRWTSASVHPRTAAATARVRSELGLAPQPTTVVVTASGELDMSMRGLSDSSIPVLIVTTKSGAQKIGTDLAEHVDVRPVAGDRVAPEDLVEVLRSRNFEIVLCEGGPHLIADLTGAKLLDELFLTISPQLAGHDQDDRRLALVEGRTFSVDEAPWAELVDLRVAGGHLFSRYRFGGTKE
jgi:riboflavin biosynthesis pyrimidine reductase